MRIADKLNFLAHFINNIARKFGRLVAAVILRQGNKHIVDFRRIVGEVHAVDDIGFVLAFRQSRRLFVGSGFGQRIDRKPPRAAVGCAVGVDADKQVGMVASGNGDAFAQRDENVGGARHIDLKAFRLQLFFQLFAHRKGNVFFISAVRTPDSAGVFAPVSGVEHDDFLALDRAAVGIFQVGFRRRVGQPLRAEVDNQPPVFLPRLRLNRKFLFDIDVVVDIKHQPLAFDVGFVADAEIADKPVFGDFRRTGNSRVLKVDNQPVRRVEQKRVIIKILRTVQNDADAVVLLPGADVFYRVERIRRPGGKRQQRGAEQSCQSSFYIFAVRCHRCQINLSSKLLQSFLRVTHKFLTLI